MTYCESCPECGNSVKPDDEYCLSCGRSLADRVSAKELEQTGVIHLPATMSAPAQGEANTAPPPPPPYVESTPEPEPQPASVPPPPIPEVQPRQESPAWNPAPEASPLEEKPLIKDPPPPSPMPHQADVYRTDEIKDTNYPQIISKCQQLIKSGYELYGLFGRPATGKSCFIYALGEHLKRGPLAFGGFTREGEAWDHLTEDLKRQWATKKYEGTERGLYFYKATHPNSKRKIAILDIAGEQFESIRSWGSEVFDFFGLYLKHCKGLFIMAELDDIALAMNVDNAAERKVRQMEHIVSFLSVTAAIGKVRSVQQLEKKKDKLIEKARQNQGKFKIEVPVALCLSKADRLPKMSLGPYLGRVVPGSDTPTGDPWRLAREVWPGHLAAMEHLTPKLKIEWLSCLGPGFEEAQAYSGSWGMASVFQHVILNPPPNWAMPAGAYRRFQKLFGV